MIFDLTFRVFDIQRMHRSLPRYMYYYVSHDLKTFLKILYEDFGYANTLL